MQRIGYCSNRHWSERLLAQYYIFSTIAISLLSCTSDVEKIGHSENQEPFTVTLSHSQVNAIGATWQYLTNSNSPESIEVSGQIDLPPQNIATVALPYPAFVKSIHVYQGTRVRKGTLLATFYHPDFIVLQQAFLEVHAREQQLYSERVRQEELLSQSISSAKAYELAVADHSIASAQRKAKEAEMRLLTMEPARVLKGHIYEFVEFRSPINGIVSKVNVNIGKLTQPDQILFELIDNAHLHAEIQVFEKDVPKLKVGQEVNLFTQTDTHIYKANIFLIHRVLNADTRHALIHCHLSDTKTDGLMPGQYIKAQIILGQHTGYAIPSEAVIPYQNGNWAISIERVLPDSSSITFKLFEVHLMHQHADSAILKSNETIASSPILTKGAFQVFAQWRKSQSKEAEE
jgi:RND family efflux transporter MFP subunit